jgi:diguanylate cyclase (GGDEF)-like protein
MTSIKKHIDDCERTIARSALNAWCSALACVGQTTERAFPGLKGGLRGTLGELAEHVRRDTTPLTIEGSQNRFELELGRWSDSVIDDLKNKTLEVKETMLTLAAAAERITLRDNRYSSKFGELTLRLQSIGRLEDISAIRQQLTASALDLKANVQRMEEEGRATVLDLQTQIEAYRAKATESERRAATDELTGLKNRRGVELAIESRRERQATFSLIFLDLNGFKKINDVHGHVVGDEVLKHFASELREQFRAADVVGRWGGDEFVVITDSNAAEIESCMNRVRRWVLGKYKVKTPGGVLELKLDAAIGVAAWDLREDSECLLARADTLMYAEKSLRR